MSDMMIRPATDNDISLLAAIIRSSYQTVADALGLTIDNCPKHPSNCTDEWIRSDFKRGVAYFILASDGKNLGCAALEKAGSEVCYLERLAVLPENRNRGCGRMLVEHVFQEAKTLGCQTIGIGIIASQLELKTWYLNIGFKEGRTTTFDHLPFDVMFLDYRLLP